VFIDGEKALTLRGANIAQEFVALIDKYVAEKFAVRLSP
jgi:(E)-4-hydroxy-3-methylbut-2-enyl-diphosphate synthase